MNLQEFLDGKKTYIGIAMVAGYYVGKYYGVPVPDPVLNTGYCMAAAGIAHKLEKIKEAVNVAKGELK